MWKIYTRREGSLYLALETAIYQESLEELQVYLPLCLDHKGGFLASPFSMFHAASEEQAEFTCIGQIEVVCPEDMPTVLMFGYDAWHEGRDEKAFIEDYDSCPNHLRGRRYGLRLSSGELVAGLNTIRFTKDLSGIASVATCKGHRKKGYSRMLLTAVSLLLKEYEGMERFMLFSEPDPSMYEKQGYKILAANHQHFAPSVAMLRANSPLRKEEARFLKTYF